MLVCEQQRLWTPSIGGGHADIQTRDLNVTSGISRSCRFVICSCLAVKLDTREGGMSSSAAHSRREREEWLWRQYFLDPTLWWDCRQDKKSPRSPDFRHIESNEPLWLNSFNKPAWVNEQLDLLDRRRRAFNPASQDNPGPPTVPDCQGNATALTVSELCDKGQLSEAVDALSILAETESRVSTSLLYTVLNRCVAENNLDVGRRVHAITVQLGYDSNAFLGTHILRMYASQGMLDEAMDVFTKVAKPNAFMWSSLLSAYANHGKPKQAIQLYREMRRSGVEPQSYVLVAALQACARAGDLESGRQVHGDVLESRVPPNSFVCNSLVDMYAKCGELEAARRVFDNVATRDVVTWNAMIAGYAEHGVGQEAEALALYGRMEQEGLISPNRVTFACLLKACTSLGALQEGKRLHSQLLESGVVVEGDKMVGTCLVDMYAKCGKLEDARRVFDSLTTKDVVALNVMINGYGKCNEGHKAIACFQEMLLAGVEPDSSTFTCLLAACSHEGLVSEGRHYFNTMVEQHGLVPSVEHCNCMIDLLGRAGHLDEAEKMLSSCESQNDAVGLRSFLHACKSHGDAERATQWFDRLVTLEPQDASAYAFMANMYADAGRWDDVDWIEALRRSAGASKKAAVAGIEVNHKVHTFVVGENRGDISCKVRSTNERLKGEGGHVPHTKLVLKPLLSAVEKEDELCGHAEKLALAYGLLNTPNGTPLLVTKNLRMCGDCHSSTEIMSRIEQRDIVVRDAHRVHRFEDGSCSCKGRP